MRKIILFLAALAFLSGCTASEQNQPAEKTQESKVSQDQTQLPKTEPKAPPVQAASITEAAKEETKAFVIYADKNAKDNHFIPSGWMGDYSDIKFNDGHSENPHSGATCIRIEYASAASGGARWAGIYWQYPENNWGTVDKFYNLTGVKKLTFWVRGEKGNEQIQEFKVGGIVGEYGDSDSSSIGPIVLTGDWKQYEINLSGKDLSHIIGGFAWSTNLDVNPEGAVFYLDDILFE